MRANKKMVDYIGMFKDKRILMNAFDYSRWRGCSESAVFKALRTGRINRQESGLLDVADCDERWENNTNWLMQRGTTPSQPPVFLSPPERLKEENFDLETVLMNVAEWEEMFRGGFPSLQIERER